MGSEERIMRTMMIIKIGDDRQPSCVEHVLSIQLSATHQLQKQMNKING